MVINVCNEDKLNPNTPIMEKVDFVNRIFDISHDWIHTNLSDFAFDLLGKLDEAVQEAKTFIPEEFPSLLIDDSDLLCAVKDWYEDFDWVCGDGEDEKGVYIEFMFSEITGTPPEVFKLYSWDSKSLRAYLDYLYWGMGYEYAGETGDMLLIRFKHTYCKWHPNNNDERSYR